MRITKLYLKNIGVFEEEEIVFKEKINPDYADIHIFTGENGTGKSTILYALANSENSESLSKRRRRQSSNHIIIEFDNGTVSPKLNAHPKILEPAKYALFAYSGYRKIGKHRIPAIQEVKQSPLQHALDFYRSVDPALLIQWIANTKTKEALATINSQPKQAKKYRKSIQRIEQAISTIIDQKVEFVLETEPLNVMLKVNNQVLEFDVLPDGLKSIISWMADLLMRMDRLKWVTDEDVLDRNFILFLDEI